MRQVVILNTLSCPIERWVPSRAMRTLKKQTGNDISKVKGKEKQNVGRRLTHSRLVLKPGKNYVNEEIYTAFKDTKQFKSLLAARKHGQGIFVDDIERLNDYDKEITRLKAGNKQYNEMKLKHTVVSQAKELESTKQQVADMQATVNKLLEANVGSTATSE